MISTAAARAPVVNKHIEGLWMLQLYETSGASFAPIATAEKPFIKLDQAVVAAHGAQLKVKSHLVT